MDRVVVEVVSSQKENILSSALLQLRGKFGDKKDGNGLVARRSQPGFPPRPRPAVFFFFCLSAMMSPQCWR